MYKRIAPVVLALTVAGLAWFFTRSSSVDPTAFGGNCTDEGLSTFDVAIVPSKRVYRIGEAARFKVVVTRALKTDEHEEGEDLGPAEGAKVALSLSAGGRHLQGGQRITDDTGTVRLRLKLPPETPRGRLDVFAMATKDSLDVPCVPHEEGHIEAPGMIRVRGKG